MGKFRTTPVERSDDHKSWHHFMRGGCHGCGYNCDDCPKGVATCKCDGSVSRANYRLAQENLGLTDSWSDS